MSDFFYILSYETLEWKVVRFIFYKLHTCSIIDVLFFRQIDYNFTEFIYQEPDVSSGKFEQRISSVILKPKFLEYFCNSIYYLNNSSSNNSSSFKDYRVIDKEPYYVKKQSLEKAGLLISS